MDPDKNAERDPEKRGEKDSETSAAKGRPSMLSKMLIPTAVMAVLAVILLAIAYAKGEGRHLAGLKSGMGMLLAVAPMLILAFVVAGMVPALIPPELLRRWVGAESGFRGIMVGTLAGGLAPGGPYVVFPVVALLLKAGAGVGTMVAFLAGWSVARVPMEVGILGWKFTLVRLACTFFFPPVAGLIARALFRGVAV